MAFEIWYILLILPVVCRTSNITTVSCPSTNTCVELAQTTEAPNSLPVYGTYSLEELGGEMGLPCYRKALTMKPPMTRRNAFCVCLRVCFGRELTPQERRERLGYLKTQAEKRVPARAKHFAVSLALLVVAGLLGIPGNLLVLSAIAFHMPRPSVTNVLIASLSVSDLLTLIICLPLTIFEQLHNIWLNESPADRFFCPFVWFLYFFSFICSILTMAAMSIERYIVICHPMKAHVVNSTSRARIVAIVVWLLSAVIAAPGVPIVSFHRGNFTCILNLTRYPALTGFFFVFLVAVVFLVPLVIMSVAYTKVALALHSSISISRQLQNKGDDKQIKDGEDIKGRIQVVRMLIVVLVAFAILWGPFLFFWVLKYYVGGGGGALVKDGTGYIDAHLRFGLAGMSYLSCGINPLLYPIASRQFRDAFHRALTCGRFKPDRARLGQTSRATGSTSLGVSSVALQEHAPNGN